MKRFSVGLEWLMAAALAIGAAPVAGQIEPGRIYAAGELVSDPELGLKLTIPAGWRGALAPDGESLRLQPEAGNGHIVVLADEMTEAEARQQLAQPVDLGDGIVLSPAGAAQEIATGHLSAAYKVGGAPSEFVGTVDVRLTQSGLGVAFILLSPPAEADAQRDALRELAFSLGVSERIPPPQAGGSSRDDAWEPYLRGLYLARYSTGGGYTDSTELWLCSNGVFYYKSQGGGFGGGASGAAVGSNEGRWSATGAGERGTLLLNWASGGDTSLELSYDYDQDRLYVDGSRMLRGHNEYCP